MCICCEIGKLHIEASFLKREKSTNDIVNFGIENLKAVFVLNFYRVNLGLEFAWNSRLVKDANN